MSTTLYHDLKRIGIDEELAHNVDKALDPAHVATKEDMVILQEAILQSQLKTEGRYFELKSTIDRVDSNLRMEIASISRQFWITFGGLITTILSVFLVNWYFHAMPV